MSDEPDWAVHLLQLAARGELGRASRTLLLDLPALAQPWTCATGLCTPGRRAPAARSCCADLEVTPTADERAAITAALPELAAWMAPRDARWATPRDPFDGDALVRPGRRSIFAVLPPADVAASAGASGPPAAAPPTAASTTPAAALPAGASDPPTATPAAASTTPATALPAAASPPPADGLHCGLHALEDASGRPRGALKPLPCRLFPLVLVDIEDGRTLLTAISRRTWRHAGSRPARAFPCIGLADAPTIAEACSDTITTIFGAKAARIAAGAAAGWRAGQ